MTCSCHNPMSHRAPPALSRRRLLAAAALAPAAGLWLAGSPVAAAAPAAASVSAAEARRRLVAGNARFVAGHPARYNHVPRRAELVKGQAPFAVVLSCSDSRVPPEMVFDRGLGDLFIVRVAGNIAEDGDIGSIEYGVAQLGASLVVVLGHEGCGAVGAAIKALASGNTPGPHLASVVTPIMAAIAPVRGRPGDPMENAVRANVAAVVGQLKAAQPVLQPAAAAGRLQIIGAEYGLASGRVSFLD